MFTKHGKEKIKDQDWLLAIAAGFSFKAMPDSQANFWIFIWGENNPFSRLKSV